MASADKEKFPQKVMIGRVRELCRRDERLVAAVTYGSFAQGEGDEFSGIEFILYFKDEVLEGADREEWVSGISGVELFYVNEFGNETAIFENLVRGEFHFEEASGIEEVGESWRETDWLPSLEEALVVDRTGELARRLRKVAGPPPERDTPERVRSLACSFVNWFLFGLNLLARGEFARALDILGLVQDQLLRMVRVREGSTTHWPNPKKRLEGDVSGAAYARYAACTARLEEEDLRSAYRAAWSWGEELMRALAARHGVAPPEALVVRLGERVAELEPEAS